MKDTAYTSLALGAHTDNTYFSDPSGLQAFHLLSHDKGTGGESLLVDGFNAAAQLHREDPTAYKILSETPIRWHASGNEGISIQPWMQQPVLEQGTGLNSTTNDNIRKLMRVRWNNDDRGPLDAARLGATRVGQWYEAARKWNEILKRPENEYWEQLKPGRVSSMFFFFTSTKGRYLTLSVFDNWRVLHGRSAFTGARRMCGAYCK
jgi:trimethyllysine dioxygenase